MPNGQQCRSARVCGPGVGCRGSVIRIPEPADYRVNWASYHVDFYRRRTVDIVSAAAGVRDPSVVDPKLSAAQFPMLQCIPNEGLSQIALKRGRGVSIASKIRTLSSP
jgi:hypothetical protein